MISKIKMKTKVYNLLLWKIKHGDIFATNSLHFGLIHEWQLEKVSKLIFDSRTS